MSQGGAYWVVEFRTAKQKIDEAFGLQRRSTVQDKMVFDELKGILGGWNQKSNDG